jgi:hypothetical protein
MVPQITKSIEITLFVYYFIPKLYSQDYSEYEGFNIEFSGLDQIGFIKRGTFDKKHS